MDREAWRGLCGPWGHKEPGTTERLNNSPARYRRTLLFTRSLCDSITFSVSPWHLPTANFQYAPPLPTSRLAIIRLPSHL